MENTVEVGLLGSKEEEAQSLKLRVWIESKKFWGVAFPAIISRLSSTAITLVTQSFMGHIGTSELAAYALIQIILVQFVNGIILGMSNALETLCGQAFGAKHYHMLGIYMQRSWIIVLVTATILVPLFIFAAPILRLIGQDKSLLPLSGEIAIWFIPILYNFVFNLTMQMYLQSQLKNTIVGFLSVASLVIHLILSWLFVIKLGWGVPGAMGAMVISTWSTTIGEFIYVIGGWCPDTWKGFSRSAFTELCPVVKLSLSSGVMLCLELWYTAILVLLAGYLQDAEISIDAFSICINIFIWLLMIFLGFLTAVCVRVSNELGRGDAEAAKFSIKVITGTSLAVGIVFFIVTWVFGDDISYIFSNSSEVAKVVSSLSILLACSVLLNSVQAALGGVAIGAGWQAVVAYVNIASYYVVGIPVGIVLAYVAHLGIQGIWIGMICGYALQTFVLACMTWRTDWDAQVEKATTRLNQWLLPSSSK